MNALDPRTILLAKHAQHVVLVHFPIAAFITAVGLDGAAPDARARTPGARRSAA